MAHQNGTRLSASSAFRSGRSPARGRPPADRLAEHLIEAYRHAAACEDPVALDLIRLALWHVGHTYPPSGLAPVEEHWS